MNVKVSYRIRFVGDVYVVHRFENGQVWETFLKSCSSEEEAFNFIKTC